MPNFLTKILAKDSPWGQFIRYAVVGGGATFVDLGFLYLFTEFFHLWYLLSAGLSFIIAAVFNYTLNKIWTFGNKSKNIARQFSLFFFFAAIGIGLNLLLIYAFTEFAGLWYIYSKIIATFFVFLWNFFGNKYFTFKLYK